MGPAQVTHFNQMARVFSRADAARVLPQLIAEEKWERIGFITSPSASKAAFYQSLKGVTNNLTAEYAGITPHTPRRVVVEAARMMSEAGVDCVVAIGGGSVIDAAKATCYAIWEGVDEEDAIDRLRGPASNLVSGAPEPSPRIIAIPTTFSAAEFSANAGVLDERTGQKEVVGHEYAIPRTVILDPHAPIGLPLGTLLATGIKALDHAVETFCAPGLLPYVEPLAARAIALLGRALPAIAIDPENEGAMAEAQLGMWMSVAGAAQGVMVGASHAIGHALGAVCAMSHGITSCITLPATLTWNQQVNAARQKEVSLLLGQPGEPAADVIKALIAELGLPVTAREAGLVEGEWPAVAKATMKDRFASTNPPTTCRRRGCLCDP